MTRRTDAGSAVVLVLALAAGAGCSDGTSAVAEIGHHRVRLLVPSGWERLDHGREQIFRRGEARIVLSDEGPGTRDGIRREVRRAKEVWLAGRRQDAFAIVHGIGGPALEGAPMAQREAFWAAWPKDPWVEAHADSVAIAAQFEGLMAGAAMLPTVSRKAMAMYPLRGSFDLRRREVAREIERTIHGTDWLDMETYDRVSHLSRERSACADIGGYLLFLRTDFGPYEQTAPAFETLLTSIEPLSTAARSGP